jgi:hypothetical protein
MVCAGVCDGEGEGVCVWGGAGGKTVFMTNIYLRGQSTTFMHYILTYASNHPSTWASF